MFRSVTRGLSVGLTLTLSCAAIAADNGEPQDGYRVFHFDQPRELTLDPTRLAVFVGGGDGRAAGTIELWHEQELERVGLDADAAEPMAVAGWSLVPTPEADRTAGGVERLVGELTARVVDRGAPSFQFISPVFVDDLGGPLIVTPQLLVGFEAGAGDGAIAAAMAAAGVGVVLEERFGNMDNTFRLAAPTRSGFDALEAANTLAQLDGVVYAEPDMLFTGGGSLIPNDTNFSSCWGLRNVAQFGGGLFDFDMDCDEAWDSELGDPSIITLIIDTGVDATHPDINLRTPGVDTTTDFGSGQPINSFDNHGTPVAGCVSAIINNNLGTVGAAPGTRSVSARTFISINASGNWSSAASWTVNSLTFGEAIGCRVTNNSNFYGFSSAAIATKYNTMRNNGIIHFASAGNNSGNFSTYPASLPTVNSIGATDFDGTLASFSNFGVDIAFVAPGDSVFSTDRQGAAGYSGTDYSFVFGTSFASPYAAGVAALVLSKNSSLSAIEVENILYSTCVDLGTPGDDNTFGWGHVNARAALDATPSPPPAVFDLVAPTPGGVVPGPNGVRLGWDASDGADSYDVFLSLIGSPPVALGGPLFQTNTTQTFVDLPDGLLAYGSGYEWSVSASNAEGTTTGTPDPATFSVVPSACVGDIDNDGATTVFDFADLASNFGAGPGATLEQGDITGDGFVDVFDFSDLASDFGCVTP